MPNTACTRRVGSRRVFEQFAWLEAGSGKMALSRPAHPRVTQAVGWLRDDSEKMSSMQVAPYHLYEQGVDMAEQYIIREGVFQHITLAGTNYEIGRRQAEILQSANEGFLNFFTSGEVHPEKYGFATFKQLQDEYEAACPGINDEIQGFADGLELPIEKIMFYDMTHVVQTNCSHMVILPPLTQDGHLLVGRSYEWKPEEEDLRLCTTWVKGKARHIGFSCLIFGRMEGMNEHGLSLTMSGGNAAGLPHEWNKKTGLHGWLVQRGILDGCRDVKDALEKLSACTPTSNTNLLIAERSGKAALVEIYAGEMQVKVIDTASDMPYLVSTNHYILPGMTERNYHQFILEHSLPRAEALRACIERDRPRITRETLREILSKEIPQGCFGPYYSGGFGTLWSMIFDLTMGEAEICFGAPGYNPWHIFTLENTGEIKEYREYRAKFPDKQ
jgi:predicted choloylglycine hydrolase